MMGADEIGTTRGMELSVDHTFSPDGRHLYSVESETNTVSVFTPEDGTSNLRLLDRRVSGEDRLR
eukprot:3687769-Rhodomonas_salina.2